MNIKEFAAELKAAGVGHNPGRIRHRLKARPCHFARVILDESAGRSAWHFDPSAVEWWLADMAAVAEARKAKP